MMMRGGAPECRHHEIAEIARLAGRIAVVNFGSATWRIGSGHHDDIGRIKVLSRHCIASPGQLVAISVIHLWLDVGLDSSVSPTTK